MSAIDALPITIKAQLLDTGHPRYRTMRADLRAITSAESAGWTVTFPRGWHAAAQFEKGDVRVWMCVRSRCLMWRRARIINGSVEPIANEHFFGTLAEALAATPRFLKEQES